jgi:hypothetical protein
MISLSRSRYACVVLLVTLPSCVNRRSQQAPVSSSTGWFGPDRSPKRPGGFLTVAPETFQPEKCVYEQFEANSDLGKIAALAGDKYEILRSDLAPFCLKFNNSTPGFPPNLQGIWWMNGNPIPEMLATFANAEWNDELKIAYLKPNEPLSWSWVANKVLGKNFIGGKKTDSTIEVNYDIRDLSRPQIMKSIEKTREGKIRQTPDYLYKYTIIDPIEDPKDASKRFISGAKPASNDPTTPGSDVLVRRTQFLGFLTGDYTLTRIVDGDGNIMKKNYEVYLKFLEENKFYYTGVQTGELFPKE